MDEMNMEELSVDMDAEFADDEEAFQVAKKEYESLTKAIAETLENKNKCSGIEGVDEAVRLRAVAEKYERQKAKVALTISRLAGQGHKGAKAMFDALSEEERVNYDEIANKETEIVAEQQRVLKKETRRAQLKQIVFIAICALVFVFALWAWPPSGLLHFTFRRSFFWVIGLTIAGYVSTWIAMFDAMHNKDWPEWVCRTGGALVALAVFFITLHVYSAG